MDEVTVREFDEDDREAVIELWRESGLLRSWNDPNRDIDRKVAVEDAMFFVAVLEEVVVGSVMAGYDGHRGWINYLAVDPRCRGDGVGRLLMDCAEQQLHRAGCPKVNLQVRADNSAAIEFYERLGFTVDDVVSMGKRLVDDATPVSSSVPSYAPVMAIASFSLVALDCPDPRALAEFYRGIVGGEVKDATASDDWVRLEVPNGSDIGFQLDPGYRPPEWPDGTPHQAHLDFDVADLDEGEQAVLRLGATKAAVQPSPDERRVFLDPAGHPFCFVKS